MFFGYTQSRQQPYGRHARTTGEDMLLEQQTAPHLGCRAVYIEAYHQAASADIFCRRYGLELGNEVFPDAQRVVDKVLIAHNLKYGYGCRTCKVVASECRSKHSVYSLELGRYEHAADRESVAHALGRSYEVGAYACILVSEETSAAAVARLYLVENKHRAGLFGRLAQLHKEIVVRNMYTGDSLNALR